LSYVFTDPLLQSAPKELDYLLRNYCKSEGYLKLDDLKQRHKEYVFNMIRVIRRCLETQILNVNTAGIGIFSLFNRLLTTCLDYYNNLDTIESVDVLKETCKTFKESYEGLVEDIKGAMNGRQYLLDSDLRPKHVTNTAWGLIAEKVQQMFTIKGHHLNILIPFPEEDVRYTNKFGCVLQNLFPEPSRQYYSFYTPELDSRLFTSGIYLRTTRERTNLRAKSFDAVIVTHDNMFDDIRPRINNAVNYLKKDGTLILVGLSTDFKRLDLRRISAALQDIQVYFYTTQSGMIVRDYELCLIVGHVKDQQTPPELPKLIDIFATHITEEKEFTLYGSGQDERPLFASYDISEAEATVLIPDVRNTMRKLLSNLLPKSIEDTRRPLLPFSAGQLGLVLISGDINGTIQEDDTKCCHVVKGSSKQRRDNKSEILATDDNGNPTRIKRTESVYSSTNVNIVLPTGQFIELH